MELTAEPLSVANHVSGAYLLTYLLYIIVQSNSHTGVARMFAAGYTHRHVAILRFGELKRVGLGRGLSPCPSPI